MKRYQPALLGGLFIGVLSSLPVLSFANCCCLWVISGGMLTAYLLQQGAPATVETGEVVLSGLVAGLVGALLMQAVTLLLFSSSGVNVEEQIRQAFESIPQATPEIQDAVLRMTAGRNIMLIGLVFNLIIFPPVAMLGALLGRAMFRRSPAPPPVQ